ncbi:MAG: RNA 2',3'-cyclic phosphodiesterase [Ignavibacteria bacterium]|nr:RNA 2',3'-cyclic phosphodiesterase [Ignavibacteria bacterium]
MAFIRTFIAFNAPEPLRNDMKVLQDNLKKSGADVKWECAEKFHATIKFLGDVEESMMPVILSTIETTMLPFRPFEVTFYSLGSFPNKSHPRVIWIGCDNPDGTLLRIKDSLDKNLVQFGFEIEKRMFHPHITLGRVRSENRLRHLTPMLEKLTFEPRKAHLDGIFVMRSVLKSEGAEYSVLKSIHL